MDASVVPSIAQEFGRLASILELMASLIELFAIVVLLTGLLRFMLAYLGAELGARDPATSATRLNRGRLDLSRYILAALEVFIVSDIVRTVISPTLEALAVLAALVAIRSAVSFFLGREMREIRDIDGPESLP